MPWAEGTAPASCLPGGGPEDRLPKFDSMQHAVLLLHTDNKGGLDAVSPYI